MSNIHERATEHVEKVTKEYRDPLAGLPRRYRGLEHFHKDLPNIIDPMVHKQWLAQQDAFIEMIRNGLSADADDHGFETEEEANDFEWDEPDDLTTTHTIREMEPQILKEEAHEAELLKEELNKLKREAAASQNVPPVQNPPEVKA